MCPWMSNLPAANGEDDGASSGLYGFIRCYFTIESADFRQNILSVQGVRPAPSVESRIPHSESDECQLRNAGKRS